MPELKRGVVSFRKSGRTWIRLFFAYYRKLAGLGGRPRVAFRHDDQHNFEKRILLIRHPCDVMVSYYFHLKVRRRKPWLRMDEFVRNGSRGILCYNRWHTIWSEREECQLVVRYEDMFDTEVWVDVLEFFGFPFREAVFAEVIEKTKFDNIRSNLEEISHFPRAWRYLAAEDGRYNLLEPKDPDAHKFRRGKVGGYVDYLSEEDITYILDNFTLGKNLESYRQQYLLESERFHG